MLNEVVSSEDINEEEPQLEQFSHGNELRDEVYSDKDNFLHISSIDHAADMSVTSDENSLLIQLDGNVTPESQHQGTEHQEVHTQVLRLPANDLMNSQENFLPGEKRSITDRFQPDIPEPSFVQEVDENGWCLIDQVGAWQSFLCEFSVMEDIPAQHRSIWAWAWSFILEKIQTAATSKELDRALMWLLFLPQGLLRQPKRGGKSGRNLTAQRFNSLVKGDWGKLVTLWERDKMISQESKRILKSKNGVQKKDNLEVKTKNAVSFISQGKVSKAASRINSFGVANISDESVMKQVKTKYPDRGRPLPETVAWGKPVDNLKGLRESLLQLERGKSPGTGGLRSEFLIVLAEFMTDQQMESFENFGLRYLCGELPAWFYQVWLSVMTVPLFKNDKQEAVRPIGIRNPLVRDLHKAVVIQNKSNLVDFLEPEQLAMSVAGGGKLVFSIRMLAEERREFVVVKIDMKNAFNEVSRASILEALEEEPSLCHLAWHAASVLAPSSGLETGGEKWGDSSEGTAQGDPLSAPYFNVAWHKYVRQLSNTLGEHGGMAKFGMDDGYAMGPSEVLFPAIERFAKDVQEKCLLVWEKTKTEVFTWSGNVPVNCTPGLLRAGTVVDGQFEPGFLCYGVPVGTDAYVEYMMEEKMLEIARSAKNSCNVLNGESQSLWTILRLSLSQQLDYWLQLCYPSNVKAAADKMDEIMWKVLETAADSSIPRMQDNNHTDVTTILVPGLREKSYQEWAVRQPIRLGGFGLRCQSDLSPAAYIGAIEQIIPSFIGAKGVCPQLSHLLDSIEDPQQRWQSLIDSGCRTGQELQKAWDILQGEALSMSTFLGTELELPLSVSVNAIGEGSINGSTRKKILEQRETMRGLVLSKALELHPNQAARPVRVWPQLDKLSTAWLLSLPGAHSGLSSNVFREAVCANLCLPSPACRDRVGESIGRARVDQYGDQVMAAQLAGDTWRIRHDSIKTEINRLLMWCSMPSTCEVFGLFSHLIPQEGLNRLERGRERQGMVPDFLIEVPCETGGKTRRLAELKVINCCPTRYPLGDRSKAVEKRASLLPNEYRRKARDADRLYGGHANEVSGPVERKLLQFGDLYGLVVGAFGEGSQDLHELVQKLAESKVNAMGLRRGREGLEEEIGVVVGQIRRSLSTTSVRAQAQCLLSRMNCVGPGYTQAAKRRRWAVNEEERMRRERQAQWVGRVRGSNIVRRGQFMLQ